MASCLVKITVRASHVITQAHQSARRRPVAVQHNRLGLRLGVAKAVTGRLALPLVRLEAVEWLENVTLRVQGNARGERSFSVIAQFAGKVELIVRRIGAHKV